MNTEVTNNRRTVAPRATLRPQPLAGTLHDLLNGEVDHALRGRPIRTGFDLLDRVLDGGVRLHDLFFMGGMPGVGKTVASLQMARNVAASGRTALYICYEHDPAALLGRLLCLELGELATPENAPELDLLRSVVLEAADGVRDFRQVLETEPLVKVAYERMCQYREHLWLVRGMGAHTGLPELEEIISEHADAGAVVFVDYLQKISVKPEPAEEAEKVTRIAEGLKDLALTYDVAIIAIVAADMEGIKAPRLRLHHFRGSSALAYECDIAVVLNDKHKTVSKVHLAYDPVRAETFKHQVVFTIEKNRGGPALVDLEFRKQFSHYRFDTRGGYVAEKLVDERLQGD